MRIPNPKTLSILALCSLGLTGCQIGPESLKASRVAYNKAVQATENEQMLLNLVRLKYRDRPAFLQIGSISTQFVMEHGASIGGGISENVGDLEGKNPDSLSLGGSVGYSERPTITFSPLTGDEFAQRMLAPVAIERIALLAHSGWSIARVLRLTVQEMNGLDNAARASGPTPDDAPATEAFNRCASLLRSLQIARALKLEYEIRSEPLTDPMPDPGTGAILDAAKSGLSFKKRADGWVLMGDTGHLIVRIEPQAMNRPEIPELIDVLHLAPGQTQYDLVAARRSHGGNHDADGRFTQIALDTRSLLGTLFFLAQAVEVPEAHREANLVTVTRSADGTVYDWQAAVGDLLQIHCSSCPPRHAAISVYYRDHWFYIADDDLNSKSTFALVGQLFNLQAGTAASGGPALTLPVGG